MLLVAIQAPDRTDPRHVLRHLVVFGQLGLVLGLLLELGVAGLVPHVVGLVVQYQQAARARKTLDERRGHGLQPFGLTCVEQQFHLPLFPLRQRRCVLALAQKLVEVGDHQRAFVGIQGARAGHGIVDLQVEIALEGGRHHRIREEHRGLAAGRCEVLQQAILHEQVGRDQDCVLAEPEPAFPFHHRVQVGPRDDEAHHLGLARPCRKLAAHLGPWIALRPKWLNLGHRVQLLGAPDAAYFVEVDEGLD